MKTILEIFKNFNTYSALTQEEAERRIAKMSDEEYAAFLQREKIAKELTAELLKTLNW